MKALMLAAGVGRRLFGDGNQELPKALLKFNGQTLIERHIEILISLGVDELLLVVGHRSDTLLFEAEKFSPPGFLSSIFNPRFLEGPKLSLSMGRGLLRSGSDVLFMDADVLYHPELLMQLVMSKSSNCILMDEHFQSTDDFVKVCISDNQIVDFGKVVMEGCEQIGEWPGFLKMDSQMAEHVALCLDSFIERDDVEGAYEEVFREVILSTQTDQFYVEKITGIPWVEIDNENDLEKAKKRISSQIILHFSK